MKSITIKGSQRESVGKVATKALRNAGQVPCVIYGGDKPVHFSSEEMAFKKLVYTPNVYTATIELGKDKFAAILQDIQFHPVTDKILHVDFYQLFENKEISMEIPDDLPYLLADERMVQQILTNLLSNAVKFTLPKGEILVSAGLMIDGGLSLSVMDNGIGIAKDKIDDVMKPFHQVETSYAKSEVGTGLGLSLVKAFIEKHEGEINIESDLGHNTTVTAFFPKHRVVLAESDQLNLKYNKSITG